MGLFVVNIVFGFSAFLLFLAAFGTMLGLIGVGAAVYITYALLGYFVQQGWILCIRMALVSQVVTMLIGDSLKKAVSFVKFKAQTFFKKNVQPILLTSA